MVKILGSRVLIKTPEEQEQKTESGILMVSEAKKHVTEGSIAGWGDKVTHTFTEGQKAIFKSWSGEEIEIDKEKYRLVDENDVLVIFS